MDLYLFALLLGFAGLAFMAFGGHEHGHGHHGAGHGHDHDAGDVSLPPHGGHPHDAAHGHDAAGARTAGALMTLLSPRVLSSVLVGMGATGLLARGWLGGLLLFLAALAGGIAFEVLLVRPLWKLLTGFASAPMRTLETAVMDTAQAVTTFDARGQGLIAVELDGQLTQVLGVLRPADRELGVRVRAGDRVLIEEVDERRNRCTVSLLGS